MKKLNLFSTLIVGMAVVVSGCHRKPSSLTPIPGMEGPSAVSTPGQAIPSGETVPSTPSVTPSDTGAGIPIGAGPIDALLAGPHNEDREKFAADTVYFDFDKATIKSSEESKLQDVATFLKSNPVDGIIIEGNCDERGTEKYNLSLGERRALAAREFLANSGVDAGRIKTVTYGASKPVDPGHSESAFKKNRRDDIVLITPK